MAYAILTKMANKIKQKLHTYLHFLIKSDQKLGVSEGYEFSHASVCKRIGSSFAFFKSVNEAVTCTIQGDYCQNINDCLIKT